ncbi:MAG: signal recognition particle-docking protein FtsY [Oscillospiraceae bacterium]
MEFFEKMASGLKKTRDGVLYGLRGRKPGEDFYEELEERLIMADCGSEVACDLISRLRVRVTEKLIDNTDDALKELKELCVERISADIDLNLDGKPAVIMLIGVNGAGKTTTAGKLANHFKKQGYSVLLAAADTFRAAAGEQLRVWSERSGVEIIEGANDPAAVVFDAVTSAKKKGIDIVIADTAGRLHTKKNLMEELAKMFRTIYKASETSSVETLLVLDAVTGQNAINQAVEFSKSTGVSGIVLTKLDGTAKGGAVISIKDKLGIPVRFVGVGEGIDDLDRFWADEFCEALFSGDGDKT